MFERMKYDKLTIIGLPKKFKVYYALDYLYPDGQLPDNPDDILLTLAKLFLQKVNWLIISEL